jgi:hypothetical protein
MTFPTPTNATQLFADVNTANSTPGFNVIPLGDFLYSPSGGGTSGPDQSMVITGNLEITGPPQLQPPQFTGGQAPTISGTNQAPFASKPLFTIASGANVILKGFNLSNSGGAGFPAISAQGNLEVDNMALAGNAGDGIDIPVSSGHVTTNMSTFSANNNGTGSGSAILNNAGTLTVNDTTVANNRHTGISGPFAAHNALFANNIGGSCNGGPTSDVNSEDDDLSCNFTSPTSISGGAPNVETNPTFHGGPVITAALLNPSDAFTAGDPSWCEHSDGRFFTLPTGSTCSIGSWQQTATLQTDTAGPTCLAGAINESSNPAVASTAQASATDAGVAGLGADAAGNPTVVLKSDMTTANGTIMFPSVPSTLFDLTAPGTNILDQPSPSSYTVTASKTVGDTTAHNTFWSFTATDWFNNTTLCQ